MAVVESNANRVVAHRFDGFGREREAPAGGEDGERILLHLPSKFATVRGGAHPPEPLDRVVDLFAVGPLDVQADLAIEVEVSGRGVLHAPMVRARVPSAERGCRRIHGMTHAQTIQDPGARLHQRLVATAPICVGIDPVADHLPEDLASEDPLHGIERFCEGVLEAISQIAPCTKIQSACFERYGSSGVRTLERLMSHAKALGLQVILDAKRGDIGISAEHYAAAAAGMDADWVTVNGYLGEDGVAPFRAAGLGVFVLVRTSNPSGDEIQAVETSGGTVAGVVAAMVDRLGREDPGEIASTGAVVGATKPEAAASLRTLMPRAPFLLPGYGAQGGGAEGVKAALDGRGGGVLVTASRSIIRAWEQDGGPWIDAVKRAAGRFAEDIQTIVEHAR